MNLFLLFAVPLAAVAVHCFLTPQRSPWDQPRRWILGAVWSAAALVAAACFGKWREFQGGLPEALFGLAWTDAVLVPGLVVGAWFLFRRDHDSWELGLWLALAFALAGLRDFVATSRTYDLSELFLVPLGRVLVMTSLPRLVAEALRARTPRDRWTWIAAAALLPLLTGAVFPVLSYGGWGAVVWVLLVAGLATSLWFQKKTAVPDQGNGGLA